jgi:hypothetical protein
MEKTFGVSTFVRTDYTERLLVALVADPTARYGVLLRIYRSYWNILHTSDTVELRAFFGYAQSCDTEHKTFKDKLKN